MRKKNCVIVPTPRRKIILGTKDVRHADLLIDIWNPLVIVVVVVGQNQ